MYSAPGNVRAIIMWMRKCVHNILSFVHRVLFFAIWRGAGFKMKSFIDRKFISVRSYSE